MKQLKLLGIRVIIFVFGPTKPDYSQFAFLLNSKADLYYFETFKQLEDEKTKNQVASTIQASMKSIRKFHDIY